MLEEIKQVNKSFDLGWNLDAEVEAIHQLGLEWGLEVEHTYLSVRCITRCDEHHLNGDYKLNIHQLGVSLDVMNSTQHH